MEAREEKNRLPEEQKFEVFGQMMTESEYDRWCERGDVSAWQTSRNSQLIKACALSDVDGVRALLGEESDGSIVEVQYVGYRNKFPVHLLTQYSKVMWESWANRHDESFGSQMLKLTHTMERFWTEYYGWEQMPEIDWQPCINFMRELYFDDNDILESAIEERGHKPIDVELFRAMGMFDFAKVEILLQQGANPNRWLLSQPDETPKYYEWNALKELWDESPDSALEEEFQETVNTEEDSEWNVVAIIFNASAYGNMFKLLRNYGYEPADMSRL